MSTEQFRPVIRRKIVQHEKHYRGSWKVAYADFMTAMFAFFLVMWIITLVPKEKRAEMTEYFRQPLMSAIKADTNSSTHRHVIPGGSPSPIPNESPIERRPGERSPTNEERQETSRLEDLKRRLETLIATNPRLIDYRPQLVLDMTPEGLRIQIVDGQQQPMFATGSARMNPVMEVILSELASTLNQMPNKLSIAGHTDAIQYASGDRAYSNWELSADRANAARKTLVIGGIAENKVSRVMGLGSTLNANEDPYSPANRRISIVVLNKRSEDILRSTYARSTALAPGTQQVAPLSTSKPAD